MSGCSTVTTSNVTATSAEQPWEGKVFISQEPIPESINHKVIGTVESKAGYQGASSLCPLLAEEAKKIGTNAVVNAQGGRGVTFFSWAAPHVDGTAIKVENQDQLKNLSGSYY
jgi:hypothetical protein